MSRWLPYLSELQPEFFCEVSPELAAERGLDNGGWATIVSARAAIEARVMVTERMRPLVIGGRTVHQIGLPYHWGVGSDAVVSGDSANDLLGVALDPNVQIQESKAGSCDIVAGSSTGRRGPAAPRGRVPVPRRSHRDDGQRAAHRAPGVGARLRSGSSPRGGAGHPGPERRLTSGFLAQPAVGTDGPRRRRGLGPARGPQGLLHGHLDLHRLQGVRGGLQGVERCARGRPRPAQPVLRQHRRARRQHVAARGLRRAGLPAHRAGPRLGATPRPARYAVGARR